MQQRTYLNWIYLAMFLLKTLFWELRFSLGSKPKIFNRTTIMLVQCFLNALLLGNLFCSFDVVFGCH
jgi:hypothetical protein